jgi:hypothetical protein
VEFENTKNPHIALVFHFFMRLDAGKNRAIGGQNGSEKNLLPIKKMFYFR